jgi:hypothetical protein
MVFTWKELTRAVRLDEAERADGKASSVSAPGRGLGPLLGGSSKIKDINGSKDSHV